MVFNYEMIRMRRERLTDKRTFLYVLCGVDFAGLKSGQKNILKMAVYCGFTGYSCVRLTDKRTYYYNFLHICPNRTHKKIL